MGPSLGFPTTENKENLILPPSPGPFQKLFLFNGFKGHLSYNIYMWVSHVARGRSHKTILSNIILLPCISHALAIS